MIQASTNSTFLIASPTLPLRDREGTRAVAKPAGRSLTVPAAMKDRSRFEGAMSLVFLGVITIAVLGCTVWMAREFIDALLSYNSVGLMRGFAGM